jgi:hypothetical protein
MEKLTTEQQAEVKKTSTERLIIKLTKAGFDEEAVAKMDRQQLMRPGRSAWLTANRFRQRALRIKQPRLWK